MKLCHTPCASALAAQLRQLEERLARGPSVSFPVEIVGTVEYREGEGVALALRRGTVQVEVTRTDAVLSWADERYRGEAAMPFANFLHYVNDGAIRLAAAAGPDWCAAINTVRLRTGLPPHGCAT